MYLECPHCAHQLEFSGDPPSFCAYCGKALAQTIALASDSVDPGATRPFSGAATKGRPAPPSSIGGYRILKRLGGGGMGEVYEAEEAASGQPPEDAIPTDAARPRWPPLCGSAGKRPGSAGIDRIRRQRDCLRQSFPAIRTERRRIAGEFQPMSTMGTFQIHGA